MGSNAARPNLPDAKQAFEDGGRSVQHIPPYPQTITVKILKARYSHLGERMNGYFEVEHIAPNHPGIPSSYKIKGNHPNIRQIQEGMTVSLNVEMYHSDQPVPLRLVKTIEKFNITGGDILLPKAPKKKQTRTRDARRKIGLL